MTEPLHKTAKFHYSLAISMISALVLLGGVVWSLASDVTTSKITQKATAIEVLNVEQRLKDDIAESDKVSAEARKVIVNRITRNENETQHNNDRIFDKLDEIMKSVGEINKK